MFRLFVAENKQSSISKKIHVEERTYKFVSGMDYEVLISLIRYPDYSA
jgi:hypothetical protein